MVWMLHGIVTWGETARESYEAMIELVTKAEEYAKKKAAKRLTVSAATPAAAATDRLGIAAPDLGSPDPQEALAAGWSA